MQLLTDDVLAAVAGGADPGYEPNNHALGRVGPGTHWKWLGNYYTPEALAHDKALNGYRAAGEGRVKAWFHALPQFPAAVASYFRARFNPGPDDMHLPD